MGIGGVRTFSLGITPKMNVVTRLEFELAYNVAAVQLVSHYTPRIPPSETGNLRKN